MLKRLGGHLLTAVVLIWTVFTLVTFLVVSIKIVGDRHFPLGLGLIQTRGWAGLWFTVPSALLVAGGLVLLLVRRAAGATLLFAYSSFWGLSLLIGLAQSLPAIIRNPIAYCTSGSCAPLPIAIALPVAFTLSALWYWRYASPSRSVSM
jgi:hypothetical protein